MQKIIDISLPLRAGMPTYPGNEPFAIETFRKFPPGHSNLSRVRMGVHCGTHVDSLAHVRHGAKDTASLPLNSLYGQATVLDLTGIPFGRGIEKEDLEKTVFPSRGIVLLKTKNSNRGFDKFFEDYVFLAESGARHLVGKKALTVGIDALGIQKFHSGNSAVHTLLLKAGVTIFEGLDLSAAKAGKYTFCGLPLRLASDGSPARAMLIKG
jgi:arylformamidase